MATLPDPQAVAIEKTLNNGAGLARLPDGRVCFVPGALDQERYQVSAWRKQRGALWAAQYQRLSDAPFRIEPTCPSAAVCGGCDLLHVAANHEAHLKAAFFRDACLRIGKWTVSELDTTAFAREQARYRGRFHANGGKLGFHERGGHRIASVSGCHVLPEAIHKDLDTLRQLSEKLNFNGSIYYSLSPDDGLPIYLFEGPGLKPKRFLSLLERSGLPVARFGLRGHEGLPLPTCTMTWCDHQVVLEADQFFQANPKSWPRFWDQVRRFEQQFQPRLIWDVHAGSGFLSAALTDLGEGRRLWAGEPDPRAITNLNRLAAKHAAEVVTVYAGKAEQLIEESFFAQEAVDALLLDPPRVGLSEALITWIAARRPRALLYFSCDSGTFARDLAKLRTAGYAVQGAAEVLDVAPGTLRFESVVTLIDGQIS